MSEPLENVGKALSFGKFGQMPSYMDEYTEAPNPYLTSFNQLTRGYSYDGWKQREVLTKKYAWAVPNPEALAVLSGHGPIIEIGAGKGYWASLIDADIICFDTYAEDPEGNTYVDLGDTYHKVLNGGHERIAEHPERTLFLCWPPYDSSMAADCLAAYTGDVFIYVGEWSGGCNGDSAFWDAIDEEWDDEGEGDYIKIPSWTGINDAMQVLRRKAAQCIP